MVLVLMVAGCAALNRGEPASVAIRHGGRGEGMGAGNGVGQAMRVVTYNVHGQGAKAIIAAVRGDPALARADVILLQEVEERPGRPVCAAVARALGMAWAFAPGYGLDGGGAHGVAILGRSPLRDLELIELPRNDTVVNTARRVALGATVDAPGGQVRVYTVHLDNRINPGARLRQLQAVLAAADDHPIQRVVIGGDLNTSPFRWLGHLVPLPVGGQLDAVERHVRARGYRTSTAGAGQTHQWLSMRLDAVYLRGGLRGGRAGVEQDVRISDHFPLWLDVASARQRGEHPVGLTRPVAVGRGVGRTGVQQANHR